MRTTKRQTEGKGGGESNKRKWGVKRGGPGHKLEKISTKKKGEGEKEKGKVGRRLSGRA